MPSEALVPAPRRANASRGETRSCTGYARKPSSRLLRMSRTTERSKRRSSRIMTRIPPSMRELVLRLASLLWRLRRDDDDPEI